MPLIAVVYCDCLEAGRLLVPHPRPGLLTIDEDGAPSLTGGEAEDWAAHYEWMYERRSCVHEQFKLAGGHIADVFVVAGIQQVLEAVHDAPAESFPMLWRLLQAGTAWSPSEEEPGRLRGPEVQQLRRELDGLETPGGLLVDGVAVFEDFRERLKGVADASLRSGKPVVFH